MANIILGRKTHLIIFCAHIFRSGFIGSHQRGRVEFHQGVQPGHLPHVRRQCPGDPPRSQVLIVIFNGPTERWRTNDCQVLIDQGIYVECSCTHLSDNAAQGETDNLVGYNVYIYAFCFICILGLLCAIIAHIVCSVFSMFSAKLLMHMCMAAMSLQIIFGISAYVSSSVSAPSCVALRVLIHFFFLAQFTWMVLQAFYLWKVFVINDEHTDRYYILFIVIGRLV
ncbi:G-protein coupled receptor 98-like isoform X2 [Acanthaster planci]|uniref:G-protein coupled receptor 98-like isoform X2 n=1 Tax=Acanthaster planci TaxID=133434 RepID=A0A8B7ZRE9_ACAPL|nr:G-protein coupled receptor 98-like isoform X2 [Acanthaster planci]